MRLLLVALLATTAVAVETGVNPIRRIVNILQRMQKEVGEEDKAQEKVMVKFRCYCKDSIEKASNEQQLSADQAKNKAIASDKHGAMSTQFKEDVATAKKDRVDAQAAVQEATGMRKGEADEYQASSAEAGQNIDSIGKAIEAISKGMGNSFIQQPGQSENLQRIVIGLSQIEEDDRNLVTMYLQGQMKSSGQILGILKVMHEEMQKDYDSAAADEKEAADSFNKLIAAKNKQIMTCGKTIESKAVRIGEFAVKSSQEKGEAEAAAAAAAKSEQMIATLKEECATKEKEYDAGVASRAEEAVAIGEAVKILNNDDALELFKKTAPSMTQVNFLQLASTKRARNAALAQLDAVAAISKHPWSVKIIALALKKADFGPVIQKIRDYIVIMKNEQKSDDETLAECEKKADELDDSMRGLSRDLKGMKAKIESLDEDIFQAKDETRQKIAENLQNKKTSQESTAQRKEQNDLWKVTKMQLTSAIMLLEKAKNALNKVYNPAMYKAPAPQQLTEEQQMAADMGEPIPTQAPQMIPGTNIPAFMQQDPYFLQLQSNKNKKSGGVIGLMDMMIKDTKDQLSEGEHTESESQKAYDALMAELNETTAANQEAQTQLEQALGEARTDKSETESALKGKDGLFTADRVEKIQLDASCGFLINNYETRRAARVKEQDGMKNAIAALSGAA